MTLDEINEKLSKIDRNTISEMLYKRITMDIQEEIDNDIFAQLINLNDPYFIANEALKRICREGSK